MNNVKGRRRLLHGVRRGWREQVKPLWRFSRAPVLLALAITVLVLGTIGYGQWSAMAQHHSLHVPQYDFLDSLYRAITLFAFAGAVEPPVPVTLEIARILAPVLTGYAAIGTILVLSREQAQLLAIRMLLRRHVVIAGLGYTGSHLALELIDREPVVVIEADPSNGRMSMVRARGVRVLVGDATDPLLLRRAGLRSCRQVVACCGSDGASIDVATAVAADLRSRRFPLTTCVHLNDLKLWQSLAAERVPLAPRDELRLEYSNVLVLAAELMLDRDRPFGSPADPSAAPRTAHLLFVGLEGPGPQLVLKAARQWRTVHPEGADGLRITVTGRDAKRDVALLRERHPQIDRYCELSARPLEIGSAEFQSGTAMFAADDCDVTRAYVCLLDEGDAILAGLALHSRSAAAHVPVTVIVDDEDTGVGLALNKANSRGANITAFGVLSETASDALLMRGTNELVARAKHEQWLRDELAKGELAVDSSFSKSWDELSEEQREDNRRFADDVVGKLESVNCMLVPNPLPDPDERRFAFRGPELEELAKQEHDRWMQARHEAGWRYGDPRDDARKLHPLMVSWERLSEEDRDKDRDPVRELPEMLERAGLKIQRRSEVGLRADGRSAAGSASLSPEHPAVDGLGGEVPTGHTR